jgi:aquaporin Z
VTNTSVNPARSTGVALIAAIFGGRGSLFVQLWMFWAAPIIGAILAGWVYNNFFDETREEKNARITAERELV